MAVAIDPDIAALARDDDDRPAVGVYSRAWVAVLVVSDVVLFFVATYFAAVVVKHVSRPALAVGPAFATAALTALLVAGVFWQLGLYRHSFAMSVRDEFYHTVAALALASAPVLVAFSVFPLISTSRLVALVALLFAIVLIGSARGIAHGVRGALHRAPLVASSPADALLRARLAKRIFDVAVAVPALVLCVPLMALVALAIALEDGAPILYGQERVGRDGAIFRMFKFRSMRVDAERDGVRFATFGDDRVTRVGRFIRRTSIDELPQLLNVLRGEMSIVGPRPERPVFVAEFERRYPRYAERHCVRPGITGWSQVYEKRVLGPEDVPAKLRGDLFYVEHWSLFLDVAVCLKTAAEVLFHKAA